MSANSQLNRIGALVDNDTGQTHLAGYVYLGINRTAQVDFAQPGAKFTWIKQGSEADGDGGDQYTGWDRFGRAIDLRWIKNSSGAELERLQHGYDRAGNRLYRANLVATSSDQQDELYSYDGLYQLSDFQRGVLNSARTALTGTAAAQEQFTFDPTGNWNEYVTKANGSTTLDQARTHNEANGLTAIDSSTSLVAEDAAGNMTRVPQPGSWSAGYDLKYDAWNRLVEVKSGSTTVAVYRYDGLHRRVTKQTGSDTRHFYYTAQWQIIEERLNSGTTADRQFVWGLRYIDDLVLRDRDTDANGTLNERLYVIQDYFQPTAVMDTSAVVVERYGYTAFGECRVMTGAFGSRTSSSYDWETRYGAYRWDAETGLCQVRHRYLHPGLGRWVTRDPIGYEAGENFYKYIFNQTTNRVDPPGLGYDINRPPNVIIGPDEARYGYPNPGAINPKPAPSSIYTMGGPVDSVLYYKICGERPGELGPYLEQALERLQREQNWPVGSNINFCISDYWSWDHPVDCLMIGFTLGQFRFTNDGTNTTISDYYAFPFGDDHNEVLAVFDTLTIPGRPFPVSGGWQTPPQTAPVRELLPPRLNPIVPIYPNNGGINSPPGRLIR